MCARACGDQEGTADALSGLAYIACLERSLSDAAEYGQEALRVYESLGHQHGIARILSIMGGISYARGEPAVALAQHCRSFAICHQLRDTAGCADVLEALAPILADTGRSRTDLVVRALSAASALRHTDGTHLTPAERATLDALLGRAAAQMGQPAFHQGWRESQNIAGSQLLALIEEVGSLQASS
jgi:hypothetical protein